MIARILSFLLLPAIAAASLPLFNGRNLQGWTMEGPAPAFEAIDGELAVKGAGNTPNWIHTDREFEDFELSFDYKLAQWAEAQVILRAPRAGRPAQSGLAIELAHDFHHVIDSYITGAIAGAKPPLKAVAGDFGVWHHVTIRLTASRLLVVIEQTVTQDIDLSSDAQLRLRLRKGFIGFPDLGYAYRVRHIEIDDKGGQTRFVELKGDSALAGWKVRSAGQHFDGQWSAADGIIRGADGHSILFAEPKAQDFELTLLVRTHDFVNSGVFLRGSPDPAKDRGFEVQIYSPIDAVYPTGSVYGMQRSQLTATLENEWFLLQIRLEGRRCLVRVNGTTVADYAALPEAFLRNGQIGLQIHSDRGAVEFRDIRIRL